MAGEALLGDIWCRRVLGHSLQTVESHPVQPLPVGTPGIWGWMHAVEHAALAEALDRVLGEVPLATRTLLMALEMVVVLWSNLLLVAALELWRTRKD